MGNLKKVLEIQEKYKIIQCLESGEKQKDVAKKFKITDGCVSKIKKSSEEIKKLALKEQKLGLRKKRTMRKSKIEKVHLGLYLWFVQERQKKRMITDVHLQTMATKFRKAFYGSDELVSMGFVQRFKRNHSLKKLNACGERRAANKEAVIPFKQYFSDMMEKYNLSLKQVYNADESALLYRFIPESSIVLPNESSEDVEGGKARRDRITIMPCSNADGSNKLPLMAIGRSKNPRCFKDIRDSLPVYYSSSQNAWMTQKLFVEWFHSQFVPSVRQFSKEQDILPKALLLLDNCSAHNADIESLKSDDGLIFVDFLPPRTTSLIQPMDQRVLYSLKAKYKKRLMLELVHMEGDDLDAKLDSINIKHAINYASESWNSVKSETILHSWNNLLGQSNTEVPAVESEIASEIESINSLLPKLLPKKFATMLPVNQIIDWIINDDTRITDPMNFNEIVMKVDSMFNKDSIQNETEASDTSLADTLDNTDENDYSSYDTDVDFTDDSFNIDKFISEMEYEASIETSEDSMDTSEQSEINFEVENSIVENLNDVQQNNQKELEKALDHIGDLEKICFKNNIQENALQTLRRLVLEKMYTV